MNQIVGVRTKSSFITQIEKLELLLIRCLPYVKQEAGMWTDTKELLDDINEQLDK